MRVDFEIDLKTLTEELPKDGQISVKLPKDQELRFKSLNAKFEKRLSRYMRDFALKLMDAIDEAS